MMKSWKDSPVIRRADGSYVIAYAGFPAYHVPNSEEFAALWAEVDAWAQAHPDQVEPEPGPPLPSLEEVKAARLAEFDAVMAANDQRLIRPLANGEADIVAAINDVQARNRALRAQAAAAETVEEARALGPVALNPEGIALAAQMIA